MDDIFRRTRAKINLSNVIHNYLMIKKQIKPETAVMSIVKADAYVHGAEFVAKELEALGTEYFGVSGIDEAIQLRQSYIKKPILILGYTGIESYKFLFEYDLTQTVFSFDEAVLLSNAAKKSGKNLKVHLKIDTGMSRLGFICSTEDDFGNSIIEILKVLSLDNLIFEGIFTHFAESEVTDSEYTKRQYKFFTSVIATLSEKGFNFKYKHCCNSAAIINFPEMQLNMVRPGIILYGLYPDKNMREIGLLPVMELMTVVSQIKKYSPDITISYNRTFSTKNDTTVAVIPIGYADGLSRTISSKADMLINGKRARVLGKICMDMTMVDITGIDDVVPGQDVIVFGKNGDNFLSVEEISEISGTINYETICRIGKRVPRVYLKEGKEIEAQSAIL